MQQDEHTEAKLPETSEHTADSQDVEQVLSGLNVPLGVLPVEAIQAAQQLGPRMVPGLVQLIRDATQSVVDEREPKSNGHFLALFLLIALRAKEAWPDILEAVTLPGDAPFLLYGDAIHEAIPRAVPVLAPDRIDEIVSAIRDVNVNKYVRWALIGGLANCVAEGLRSREEIVGVFCSLLKECIAEKSPENVLALAFTLIDLCPREAREDLERAFDEDLLYEGEINREEILDAIELGEEQALENLTQEYRPIVDVVETLCSWAAFQPDRRLPPFTPVETPRVAAPPLAGPPLAEPPLAESPMSHPIRHTEPHVGRNDPCPCGSGKKFKKCCARSARDE
jgi:hypothetical protein